jgi:hypothetical protein
MVCRPLLHKTLLKLKGKKSGLYTKDIYGTRALCKRDEILTPSSLHREMVLRVAMNSVKAEYNRLMSIGMLQWPSYKEEEAAINRMLQTIYRALDSFRSRRIKIGLFYLSPPPPNRCGHIMLQSPLYRMTLKEALERRRLQKKKRKEEKKKKESILSSYSITAYHIANAFSNVVSVTSDTILQKVYANKSLLTYTIASIFIGCIIVLIPN